MDWSEATIRSIGAVLGVPHCTETELEAKVSEMGPLFEEVFYNPKATSSAQGKLVAAYLRESRPALVPQNQHQIGDLIKRAEQGLSPEEILWYPYAAGPGASMGYYAISDDQSQGPHYGMRNEWWSVTGSMSVGQNEATVTASVHRFQTVPPSVTEQPQNVWRLILGVLDGGTLRQSVYTVPGGIGLVHVQAQPFELVVGTQFSLKQEDDFLYRLKFHDVNNGNTVDVTITNPVGNSVSRILLAKGGTGLADNWNPQLGTVGLVNGLARTGNMDWAHQWENGVFPPGFENLYSQRSLQMFPLKYGTLDTPCRYLSASCKLVGNDYHVALLWLNSPTSNNRHPSGSKQYVYIYHLTVLQEIREFTIDTASWMPGIDEQEYPRQILLTIPSYDAEIRWILQANQFYNLGTDGVPIYQYMGQATVRAKFLGGIEPEGVGYSVVTNRANQDELSKMACRLLDVEPYPWPRPSTNQTAEAFFYWLTPAVVFAVLLIVVVFVVRQIFPTQKKVVDGRF